MWISARERGGGALQGDLAASVSPPMKAYPGDSYPSPTPGMRALLGLSQSHPVLQLLLIQDKEGTPSAVFQAALPKVGEPQRWENGSVLACGLVLGCCWVQ